MKWHDITREELYEKVWEKPASQLKEEFGVSDVAIAKACRKMEIPKPPRGYRCSFFTVLFPISVPLRGIFSECSCFLELSERLLYRGYPTTSLKELKFLANWF